MKILIFYFSGNGNTKWTVETFEEIAREKYFDVELMSIEDMVGWDFTSYHNSIKNADIIGFGTPIYGSNLPRIMTSFIQTILPQIDKINKNATYMFMNTYGYVNGFGIFKARQLLKAINKKPKVYFNAKLFNSAPSRKDHSQITENELAKRKAVVILKLKKLCEFIEGGKTYIKGLGPHLVIGIIIRNLLRKSIENNYKAMICDGNLCTDCGKCIVECPTKSIIKEGDGICFSDSCTSCMRCYNNCPVQAISVGKYSGENGYKQYRNRLSSFQGFIIFILMIYLKVMSIY